MSDRFAISFATIVNAKCCITYMHILNKIYFILYWLPCINPMSSGLVSLYSLSYGHAYSLTMHNPSLAIYGLTRPLNHACSEVISPRNLSLAKQKAYSQTTENYTSWSESESCIKILSLTPKQWGLIQTPCKPGHQGGHGLLGQCSLLPRMRMCSRGTAILFGVSISYSISIDTMVYE